TTFDEADARCLRISREGFERKHQRPFHQTVNDQLVLVRINIRDTAMTNREMQSVRRDYALKQLMWRACPRVAWEVVRIVDGSHHSLFKPGRHLIRRHDVADLETPCRIGKRFGRRTRSKRRGGDAHCTGNRSASS